ncbi:hypothetical protein B0H14DRAFT_2603355 [Mycena olivaceomarginata]|nr:hypothetical protein B0H14DRAFT_2603355 [Mycena olivaceomarginata]
MEMLDTRPTKFQQIPTVFGVFEWFSPAHTVVRSVDCHQNPSVEDNGNQRIKAPVERDQGARKLGDNDQTVKAKMGHNNNEQDGDIPSTYKPCQFWRKPLELRGWNRYNGPVYSAGDWGITPRLLHMEMKHAFTVLQQSTCATVTNTGRRRPSVATGGQRRPPANFLPPGILLQATHAEATYDKHMWSAP